jgi:hypothetical protein
MGATRLPQFLPGGIYNQAQDVLPTGGRRRRPTTIPTNIPDAHGSPSSTNSGNPAREEALRKAQPDF